MDKQHELLQKLTEVTTRLIEENKNLSDRLDQVLHAQNGLFYTLLRTLKERGVIEYTDVMKSLGEVRTAMGTLGKIEELVLDSMATFLSEKPLDS